jgi:hypothetical protein
MVAPIREEPDPPAAESGEHAGDAIGGATAAQNAGV